MLKLTTMNIKKWIRSKFYRNYAEITMNDIIDFLQKNFSTPTGTRGENIIYIRPRDLLTMVNDHFGQPLNKQTVYAAFSALGYKTHSRRDSHFSKDVYKVIPLVKKSV